MSPSRAGRAAPRRDRPRWGRSGTRASSCRQSPSRTRTSRRRGDRATRRRAPGRRGPRGREPANAGASRSSPFYLTELPPGVVGAGESRVQLQRVLERILCLGLVAVLQVREPETIAHAGVGGTQCDGLGDRLYCKGPETFFVINPAEGV